MDDQTRAPLHEAQQRMRDAGVSARAVAVFSDLFGRLEAGTSGFILESDVDPLTGLDHLENVDVPREEQRIAAAQTAVIKLNGGLGTTMGMDRAKSLLPVRDGLNFLDVIVGQVRAVRASLEVSLPLIFMDSFRTHQDTLDHLARYRDLPRDGIPLDFVQSKEPRLRSDTLAPVDWPDDPELEWCPPGHGDIYTAIVTSGLLDALVERGITQVFISNADNLGARPDPDMMAWFSHSGAPYAAEVCRRSAADVKGGHLVVRKSDGRIVLRETAQTSPEDHELAQDRVRHRFFHTNNLWINLVALRETLDARGGVLGLPLIRNVKHVVANDESTPEVIQLETAMGAAIEIFDGATAIEVDRSRFLPVKSTNDLALLRSDVYDIDENFIVSAQVEPIPLVNLDRRYYATIGDFTERMPESPSLTEAASLTVHGDWYFEPDVVVLGHSSLNDPGGPSTVSRGTVLGSLS